MTKLSNSICILNKTLNMIFISLTPHLIYLFLKTHLFNVMIRLLHMGAEKSMDAKKKSTLKLCPGILYTEQT